MTQALGCYRWGAIWRSLCSAAFFGAGACGAIFSLTATEARAQSDAPSDEGNMGLSFSAPQSCQDRSAFISRVQAYTSKAHFTDDAAGRLFAVSIAEAGPEQLIGNLEIVSASERATRTVSGKTCPELLDALALMTALAIDPDALTATQPQPPIAHDKPPPKPTEATLKKKLPRKSIVPVIEDHPRWSIGAEGWLLQGVLPDLAWGGAAFVNLRTSTQAKLRATFTLGAHYFTQGNQEVRALRIGYAALGLHTQGCAELALSDAWLPALCINALLGRQRSRTEDTSQPLSSGARTWAGLGIGPRLDWNFANHWALRLEGNLGTHLIENRVLLLAIEPNGTHTQTLTHETQGLFTTAALGLLFHF
jgi:hypothetical protein